LELLSVTSGNSLCYGLHVTDASGAPVVAHGVAFAIQFDSNISNVTMDAINSSLQPHDELTVYDTNQNKLHIALTRIDRNNVLCDGPVATFEIVFNNDVSSGEIFTFTIENGTQILANGTPSSIADLTIYDIYTGTNPTTYVYPGDFNYDGTANETDYLYWGLAHGNTGPVRPNASTTWVGQDCSDWTQDVQSINGKHQDGNGNGTVNDTDQQALLDNFGKTHNFTQPAYLASSTQYLQCHNGCHQLLFAAL